MLGVLVMNRIRGTGYPTDEILSYNFLYAKKGRIPLFLQKFFEKFSWSRKRGTNHRLSLALGAGVWYDGGDLRAGLRPGYVDGNPAVV